VLVVLVALWATGQSLRRKNSIFNLSERKWIWFWAAGAVLCLMLAFGRYAPFYRVVYALPYFSTIRNPTKFLHLFSLCLVVLFAYGIEGLVHLEPTTVANPRGKKAGNQKVEPLFSRFDQLFILGSILVLLMAVGGWILYGSQKNALAEYLVKVRFPVAVAEQIADFSVRQVGWFLLLLAVTVALFALVVTGALGPRRSRFVASCLGLLLVLDLGRANLPWIVYWNYVSKYASNPVLDILRDHPNEHRVTALSPAMAPFTPEGQGIATLAEHWSELYNIEWLQHLFSYYNIQSLDLVQMRVMPADMRAFGTTIGYDGFPGSERLQPRFWELCNNRYLLGPAAMLDILNQKFDGGQHRFRLVTRFQLVPKPGISRPVRLEDLTVALGDDGDFALFEFTGALPRAKLFTNWQVVTNDRLSLAELASERFDPEHSVILSSPSVSSPPTAVGAPYAPGDVSVLSYAPKDIVLEAHPKDRSVLLLNDRFDPEWEVLVDGQIQPLLRCNYIMRGVELAAGDHRVEFRLRNHFAAAWLVSLGVTVLALGLTGVLLFRPKETVASSEPCRPTLSRAPA
jgi:hypothetical protein